MKTKWTTSYQYYTRHLLQNYLKQWRTTNSQILNSNWWYWYWLIWLTINLIKDIQLILLTKHWLIIQIYLPFWLRIWRLLDKRILLNFNLQWRFWFSQWFLNCIIVCSWVIMKVTLLWSMTMFSIWFWYTHYSKRSDYFW